MPKGIRTLNEKRKGDEMNEMNIVMQDLVTSCQRAVMLLRALGVPQGEIDHLQAAIDRYYEARMAKQEMPGYCTQNDGDCRTCSLVNYNRDCHNRPLG